MIAHFMAGISYLFRGLALLVRPDIRPYVIVPLVLNIGLFGVGLWYAYGWLQTMLASLESFLPSWLHWLQWLLIPLFVVTMAIGVFYTFSALANLVAAPFNSLLAEQVEHHLTGRFPEGEAMGWKVLLAKTPALLWNEVSKILYALLWAMPCLIVSMIPLLNVAAPFLWIIYSAWMMVIQYLDIPMGNHDIPGKQVRQHARDARAMSLGFGGVVVLMAMIPFVNFLVMPAAVAGGTLLWVERFLPTASAHRKPPS